MREETQKKQSICVFCKKPITKKQRPAVAIRPGVIAPLSSPDVMFTPDANPPSCDTYHSNLPQDVVAWNFGEAGISQIMRAIALPVALIAAFLLSNCGNGLPHSNQVTAKITPAQATVAVGATVALDGDATGFTQTPIVRWWVQEARDAGGDDCGYLQLPAVSPCPFGYVIYADKFPSSATYYAPATTGTYHVTFEVTQFSYGAFDHLTKTATATITTTP